MTTHELCQTHCHPSWFSKCYIRNLPISRFSLLLRLSSFPIVPPTPCFVAPYTYCCCILLRHRNGAGLFGGILASDGSEQDLRHTHVASCDMSYLPNLRRIDLRGNASCTHQRPRGHQRDRRQATRNLGCFRHGSLECGNILTNARTISTTVTNAKTRKGARNMYLSCFACLGENLFVVFDQKLHYWSAAPNQVGRQSALLITFVLRAAEHR